MFCEGVSCPQSMGIGGGFIATIYEKSTETVKSLIARETAPLQIQNSSSNSHRAMSIGVPGELLGYWELHKNYGKLSWESLIQPAINLCRNGHIVTNHLSKVIGYRKRHILKTPPLYEIFINPNTQNGWNQGDIIFESKLGDTLEIIAKEGVSTLYDGGIIGKYLIDDIQNFGGILTEEDLHDYHVRWVQPESINLNEFTLYTCSLPGGGPLLCLIMNIMKQYLPFNNEKLMWHRLIESFKHAYGLRTQLGDIEFEPQIKNLANSITSSDFAYSIRKKIFDKKTYSGYKFYGVHGTTFDDKGTANIAVLGENGDAIVITSSVNDYFGCGLRSHNTGIILNDALDDFSINGDLDSFGTIPSKANYIKPRKIPLSSMSPTIILDENENVRLLIGAAGGSKIITSIVTTIIRHLFLNESLDQAMNSPRIYHQLASMIVQCEAGFNEDIINYLKSCGHSVEILSRPIAALTAISVDDENNVIPIYDLRRDGSSSIL